MTKTTNTSFPLVSLIALLHCSCSWKLSLFQKHKFVAGFLLPFSLLNPSPSTASDKVAVLGGTGFVGSRVVRDLVVKGADVISVSRSGTIPAWAFDSEWSRKVEWRKGDPITSTIISSKDGLSAVVSTIGVIGLKDDQLLETSNGDVNVEAVKQAKEAGATRFVYVGVGSLVPEAFDGKILPGYFAGKAKAEAEVQKVFGDGGVVIKPTFIYGGDSFSLNPPRVTAAYGSLIDSILSSGLLRAIASVSPPLLKVALVPPVSVDTIAHAISAAALGQVNGVIDGTDAIGVAAEAF